MHISNLVYQLPSEMPCVAERPWPLASLYTPDAESALCHVFLLLIKDKTRLCECHTPPWDLPSSHIKENVRWTATADSYTSHPLLCNLRALSSSNKHGKGEHCGSQSGRMRGQERNVEDGFLVLSEKRSTLLLSMNCLLKPAIKATTKSFWICWRF